MLKVTQDHEERIERMEQNIKLIMKHLNIKEVEPKTEVKTEPIMDKSISRNNAEIEVLKRPSNISRNNNTLFVDCFIFNDELDLLEFRLTEHNDFVDLFILVECEKTFSKKEKPLYANNNYERYSKWHEKLIIVKLKNVSDVHGFGLEDRSRDAGIKMIEQMKSEKILYDEDIISVVSDVDEIYDKDEIVKYIEKPDVIKPHLRFHYYSLKVTRPSNPHWAPQKRLKIGMLKSFEELSLLYIQHMHAKYIYNFGWHLSYFGGVDTIIKKMSEYSHCGMQNVQECIHNPDLVKERITKGVDILGRDWEKLEFKEPSKLPIHWELLKTLNLDIFI